MLKHMSARDLILIAALAAIGIAIKPVVGPFFKMLSRPLGIPGGSFAGGFYMMWLVLAIVIVQKPSTGLVFGVLQAIGVLIFGISGNQGALSLVSYAVPGLMADLVYLSFARRKHLVAQMSMCAIANAAGALISVIVLFNHPLPIVLAVLGMAMVSGMVGGVLSFGIYKSLKEIRII
jgi:energy-coupling factor transport system substrate-specific component